MSAAVELTQENVEALAHGHVAIYFWASTCGPCRMFSPIVEKVADQFAGRVNVFKCQLDTDFGGAVAHHFGVRAMPQIMFYTDGQPVAEPLIGPKSTATLTQAFNAMLADGAMAESFLSLFK